MTRALDHRRPGSTAKSAAAALVVLFGVGAVALLAPRIAHSASPDNLEISSTPIAPPEAQGAARDIAIETVAQGREGLELSARLTDDGGIIERPIDWTVTTIEGESVYRGETPTADVTLKPGDYRIAIKYGAVDVAEGVTVVDGTRLIVSFVLDAGGIRVLPRLQNLGLPDTPSRSSIFALTGLRKGQLVASSTTPGEVLRVPSGEYRIESRFEPGNATAVTDVTVKAGLMSAIEIDHAAGLARLSFVGAPDAQVSWRVSGDDGSSLPAIEGLSADVVLKPGTYTAAAQIGGETLTAKFEIAAGQTRDIILGN